MQMEGVRLVVNKGLSNHFQVSHHSVNGICKLLNNLFILRIERSKDNNIIHRQKFGIIENC